MLEILNKFNQFERIRCPDNCDVRVVFFFLWRFFTWPGNYYNDNKKIWIFQVVKPIHCELERLILLQSHDFSTSTFQFYKTSWILYLKYHINVYELFIFKKGTFLFVMKQLVVCLLDDVKCQPFLNDQIWFNPNMILINYHCQNLW